VNTRDELLARILVAAASVNKREDQLRQMTRDLRTRVAKCTEIEDGIFEYSSSTVTNCVKSLIKKLN
jgi:hypothetical protein